MSISVSRGISRRGLDGAFEAQEARKSHLILDARMLGQQGRDQDAADRFAQAAEIEEGLADACEARGLLEKSFVHRFSAAGCWAQAGNFYYAIGLCDTLLDHRAMPDRLRRRVSEYRDVLRTRRARWYVEVAAAAASGEP